MTVCELGIKKTEHTCDHCGDLFKSRATLVKHLRKHGAKIPPPPSRAVKRKEPVQPQEVSGVSVPQEGEVVIQGEEAEVQEVLEVQISQDEVQEGEIVQAQVQEVQEVQTSEDIVQHAIQLHEIHQGGGDAAILLQRIANSDGEEAEALETALQLVQLEFVPAPGGANPSSETIQVVAEDGTVVENNIIQHVEEVTEHQEQ